MTPLQHSENLKKTLDEAYRLAKLEQKTYIIVETGIGKYACFSEDCVDVEVRNKACIKVFSFGVYTSLT